MNPRLVAIAGPLKGTTFPLTEEEVSIGRETSNRLCIRDPSISRRHCVIKKEEEQFKVTDLESLNSTFVNDMPVKERTLEHGDQIKFGSSLFLFLLRDDEPVRTSSKVELDEGGVTGDTIRVRVE